MEIEETKSHESGSENPPRIERLPEITQKRNLNMRHFKALMRKNAINWRRTICGSALEILCPVFLMFILVYTRTQVVPYFVGEYDIYALKAPIYPIASLNDQTNNWTMSNFDATRRGLKLSSFMEYTEYLATINLQGQTLYEPLLDPLGPYYFFPNHCYKKSNRYASPIIAYIGQDNQIEQDMIIQLELLMQKQKWLKNYIPKIIKVLQKPSNSQTLQVFLQLFDGGDPDQIQKLIQDLGLSSQFALALRIANSTQNNQNFTSLFPNISLNNFSQINFESLNQLINTRQILQSLRANVTLLNETLAFLSNLTEQASLNQTQIQDLLNITLFSTNLTQFQAMLPNLTATSNLQLLNLTEQQNTTLTNLLNNQLQNTTINQLMSQTNTTLNDIIQNSLMLTSEQNQTLQQILNQDLSQNQTLQSLLQALPEQSLAKQLGLNETQAVVVNQAITDYSQVFLNQTVRDAINNWQDESSQQQILSQIGLNQTLSQEILQVQTIDLLTQNLGLTQNQNQLLQNLTSNYSLLQAALQNQNVSDQLIQTLNLSQAQQSQLALATLILTNRTQLDRNWLVNQTNLLALNNNQQNIVKNLTEILYGQQNVQQIYSNLNLTQVSQELGLSKNQTVLLENAIGFINASLSDDLQNLFSNQSTLMNTTQDLYNQFASLFGFTQNQTSALQDFIKNQTQNITFANYDSLTQNVSQLLNISQSLVDQFAQQSLITTELLNQLQNTINLNTTQNNQIQQLIDSDNQTFTFMQLAEALNLNQNQIDSLQQAVTQQAQLILQGNNTVNTSQVEVFQNTLSSLGLQNLEQQNQNLQDLIWQISPLNEQTVQYLYYVVQSLAKGQNISSILSPELQKFTSQALNEQQLNQITSNSQNDYFGSFYLQRFESKAELDAYIEDKDYGWGGKPGICFGFQVIENKNNDYEVELFFNDQPPNRYKSIPNQRHNAYDPTTKYPRPDDYKYYIQDGFSYLQNWFANTILKRKTGVSDAEIATMIVPVKIPSVYQDNFVNLLQLTLTLFMLLMYIPALYRTVYRIVYEKQSKAKESMRMMGMNDFPYWSSWFAYYTIVNTLISTLSWAVLQLGVFNHKSALVLYILIWLYGQSLFGLTLITQSLFTSPRACAITTTVVYFGTSLLAVLTDNADTPKNKKIAVCWFFPTVTLGNIIKPLVMFDSSIGNTISSWNMQFQQFSVKEGLIMFIIGGINMLILGLYLEQVMPKTYGNKKHPLFFLGIKECSCKKRKFNSTVEHRPSSLSLKTGDRLQEFTFETKYLKAECFEPADFETRNKEYSNQILKVADLRKEYENGFKAVNGVNLMMYSDQIFVLLGHNGAGKTTTISMLTGLFNATEGEASVFGVDIFKDMEQVRQFMGVCPQHDILFEFLTTQEHLEFFYDLKGADPSPQIKEADINKLMNDVGVSDKKNSLASQLSGGNQRKLSVAIALCGGSKFVLLDEPTSGMDIQARRQLWNMLKACKKDRIVILTTHYMDEADILGDRIGIMANGKLTCLGTSMFLKNKFGVGYNLAIIKASTDPNQNILEYLQYHLGPKVRQQSEIQSEMTIQIPLEYSQNFSEFFTKFDRDLADLKIVNYGVSISTLEEVFLKVGHLDDPTSSQIVDNPSTQSNQSQASDDLEQAQNLTDIIEREQRQQAERFNLKDNFKELDESFLNNLQAILFKRFSNYRRNTKAVFNEAILPAIIMLIGVLMTQYIPQWRSPSRILSPNRLPLPQKLMINPFPTVKSDVLIEDLVQGLPGYNSKFQTTYSSWNNTTSMRDFGILVYDFGNKESQFPPYMYGSYQVYQADRQNQQYKFISWVNLTAQDSTGLYPQFMYESILKAATNDSDFKFKTRLTTYPTTAAIKVREQTANSGTIVFMSAVAYSMMVTAIVSYLVVERISGLKHLQVISGMNLKAYWVGNFIFDLIKMELTIVVTISLFFGFEMGFNSAWATYVALPFGIIPFSYVMSYWFTVDSAAQTFTMFFHFFILGIMSTLTFGLRLAPDQQRKGDILNGFLKTIPSYPLGSSLFCDTACSAMSWQRKNVKPSRPSITPGGPISEDVWAFTNNTGDVIVMFMHLIVWSVIISLIENKYFSWFRFRPNVKFDSKSLILDQDVNNEVQRVKNLTLQDQDMNEQVIVQNLKKVYRQPASKIPCITSSLLAVSDLSFALRTGECFALLGVNGAGKSTTFKSLTREVQPTSGKVFIGGFDIQKQFMQARKLMGYCAQPNLIFDTMSVEEHIQYYAKIKGIPKKYRSATVEMQIKNLDLEKHRKKTAGTLSGGNKRKLCVAIALVGNPPFIFLDEPSAGMDPEARRFMWSVVGKIAKRKTSAIVLTTHSMEEAEALSTKMGIMVKGGVFKCFGSAQHIRTKFGTGYVIEIKAKNLQLEELPSAAAQFLDNFSGQPNFENFNFDISVQQEILNSLTADLQDSDYKRKVHSEFNLYSCIYELCQTFRDVKLVEKYGNYMRVKVCKLDRSIGQVFSLLETFKVKFSVSEYSVSQTTLEQIFQSFANPNFDDYTQTLRIVQTEFHTLPSLIDTESKPVVNEQKPRDLLTIIKK